MSNIGNVGAVGTITPVKATSWETFYSENILGYFQNLKGNPFELVTLVIDLAIVVFLLYYFFKAVKGSRAWQLIKGIALLLVATWISGFLNLKIVNAILTAIMNIGLIAIIVIFQPELRRALEQLGTNIFPSNCGETSAFIGTPVFTISCILISLSNTIKAPVFVFANSSVAITTL